MLDVHPPHHASQSWRDFLVHIATIVVGLLIAIALEQSVEWLHNRHLLHHAEINLRAEMRENRQRLLQDVDHLNEQETRLEANLALLAEMQAHHPAKSVLDLYWSWNGPHSAAWDAARANGAIALMPYDVSETWSTVYGQQQVVDAQTAIYIRDIYQVEGPLPRGRNLSDLRPEEVAAMIADSHKLLGDLRLLRDLCNSQQNVYRNALNTVE